MTYSSFLSLSRRVCLFTEFLRCSVKIGATCGKVSRQTQRDAEQRLNSTYKAKVTCTCKEIVVLRHLTVSHICLLFVSIIASPLNNHENSRTCSRQAINTSFGFPVYVNRPKGNKGPLMECFSAWEKREN